MKLQGIDVLIIVAYLLAVSLIGVLLKRRASRSLKSYLLGGNELPWYLLGLSNASGMFDISGTMWLVTILFVYGLKSVWLPWLWPTFNQIFLMIFLSAWLRRSNVTTGALPPAAGFFLNIAFWIFPVVLTRTITATMAMIAVNSNLFLAFVSIYEAPLILSRRRYLFIIIIIFYADGLVYARDHRVAIRQSLNVSEPLL